MFFFFSSRRRHTRYWRDWSSDVCSSDLVDHKTSPGAGGNSRPQVVTDKGAVLDLTEEIDNENVARLQHIDHPGVLTAAATLGGAHTLDDSLQVRSQRHHAHGDRAADEDPVRVQIDPVPLELEVVIVTAFDHTPGFIVRDPPHPLQNLIGYARPAIGEALFLIERSERRDAFRTVEDHERSSRESTPRPRFTGPVATSTP